MTQTLTNDMRLKLAAGSRKLLSESDRKKMSRYNFHTNWMSNCQSLSDLSSCMSNPETGSNNSRNLTTTKETTRERGLRIKCLLKGEDQYRPGARKTLNLRFGTCIIRGQGVKGWLWQGRVPESLTWEQRMWTMSNGGRVQDGAKWGQSVSTETSGHFLESGDPWPAWHSVMCNISSGGHGAHSPLPVTSSYVRDTGVMTWGLLSNLGI